MCFYKQEAFPVLTLGIVCVGYAIIETQTKGRIRQTVKIACKYNSNTFELVFFFFNFHNSYYILHWLIQLKFAFEYLYIKYTGWPKIIEPILNVDFSVTDRAN